MPIEIFLRSKAMRAAVALEWASVVSTVLTKGKV